MMVFVNNRSMKLPRKAKRKRVSNNTPVRSLSYGQLPAPYRPDDHRNLPSQLEKRTESGRWLSKEEHEALQWLASME